MTNGVALSAPPAACSGCRAAAGEGDIGANDVIESIERPSHGVTLDTMVGALHDPAKARALQVVEVLPRFWRHVAERDH